MDKSHTQSRIQPVNFRPSLNRASPKITASMVQIHGNSSHRSNRAAFGTVAYPFVTPSFHLNTCVFQIKSIFALQIYIALFQGHNARQRQYFEQDSSNSVGVRTEGLWESPRISILNHGAVLHFPLNEGNGLKYFYVSLGFQSRCRSREMSHITPFFFAI